MADSTFQIDIIADINKSLKSIKEFSGSVDKEVKSINKMFSSLSSFASGSLAVLGSTLAAVGVGFSIREVINQAVEAEDAVSRFNGTLQQTKSFTEEGSLAFQEFALSVQRSTGIADEAVLDLASNIQRFAGLSQRDLAQVTKATIDFATFANIDLQTAAQAIGKALQGNEGALARYGVLVRNGKTETEQLNNVLTALGISSGFAEKKAKTFSGQLNILKGEFSEILETLGKAIIKNNLFIDSLSGLKNLTISVSDSISDNNSILNKTVNFFVLLGRSIAALGDIVYRIIRGALATLQLALGVIVGLVVKAAEKFTALFTALTKGAPFFKSIERGLNTVSEALFRFANNGGDYLKNGLTKDLLGFRKETEKTIQTFDKFKTDLSSKKGVAAGLKEAIAPDEKAIENAFKNANISRSLKEITVSQEEAAKKGGQAFSKEMETAQNKQFEARLGVVASTIGQISQGPLAVISSLASATGPLGSAIAGAVQFFAQGPEAVRAQTQAFIDNIPVIIQAITDSIPVFIEVLAANSGKIVTALSLAMPNVANTLAIELTKQSPNIAKSFVDSMIAEAGRLVQSIADGVKQAISRATGIGGGGGGGILGAVASPVAAIGRKLRFADGGIVPGGFPNDSFPAQLTSGEGVIPVDTMRRLDQYLSRADAGGGQSSGGGTTIIKLVVGEQELANVLLSLNQRGFRVS